nr:MAG TPA: hypothetical protein [Caudoviricetes sp.]
MPGLPRQSVKASRGTAAQSQPLRKAFLQASSLKNTEVSPHEHIKKAPFY